MCLITYYVHHLLLSIDDGFLKHFFEKTKNMSPDERARALETEDVS